MTNALLALADECELYAKVCDHNMRVVPNDWDMEDESVVRLEPKETLLKAASALRVAATHAPALDREAVAAMADRFWRIHPKELDEIGLERREFYAREIEALFRSALLPAAPVEPKPAGEGEPVAWRWRIAGQKTWQLWATKPVRREGTPSIEQVEIEPLYAAPIPSPAPAGLSAEEMRERCAVLVENVCGPATQDMLSTEVCNALDRVLEAAAAAIRAISTNREGEK